MNLYRYVGNSAPNFTDPSGLTARGMMSTPGSSRPDPSIPVATTYGSGPPRMTTPTRPSGSSTSIPTSTTYRMNPFDVIDFAMGWNWILYGPPSGPYSLGDAWLELDDMLQENWILPYGQERCNRFIQAARNQSSSDPNYKFISDHFKIEYVWFRSENAGSGTLWREHAALKITISKTGCVFYYDDRTLGGDRDGYLTAPPNGWQEMRGGLPTRPEPTTRTLL